MRKDYKNSDDFVLDAVSLSDDQGNFDPRGTIWVDGTEAPELEFLRPFMIKARMDHGRIVIDFDAQGYHDPGQMHGGPQGVGYAPEWDDQVEPTNAYLETYELIQGPQGYQEDIKAKVELPPKVIDALYEVYSEKINDGLHESVTKNIAKTITEDPDIFI